MVVAPIVVDDSERCQRETTQTPARRAAGVTPAPSIKKKSQNREDAILLSGSGET
jgi:hypothetical protein